MSKDQNKADKRRSLLNSEQALEAVGHFVVVRSNLRATESNEMNYEPLLAGRRLTLYHAGLEEISPELPKEAVYKA